MRAAGKLLLFAVILLAVIYWAASNPNTAGNVKSAIDNSISFLKEVFTD